MSEYCYINMQKIRTSDFLRENPGHNDNWRKAKSDRRATNILFDGGEIPEYRISRDEITTSDDDLTLSEDELVSSEDVIITVEDESTLEDTNPPIDSSYSSDGEDYRLSGDDTVEENIDPRDYNDDMFWNEVQRIGWKQLSDGAVEIARLSVANPQMFFTFLNNLTGLVYDMLLGLQSFSNLSNEDKEYAAVHVVMSGRYMTADAMDGMSLCEFVISGAEYQKISRDDILRHLRLQ